jgi:hypothetical protein
MMITSACKSGMSFRDRHSGLRCECKRQTLKHLAGCRRFGVTEGHCLSKQSDRSKYFSDDRLDFMKQRVRKESGLQKLEPESYREYQQRHAVIFNL